MEILIFKKKYIEVIKLFYMLLLIFLIIILFFKYINYIGNFA